MWEIMQVCLEWVLIICLSSSTSRQEVVQAEMLPYLTATNPYYFPVVIIPVLVLCRRLSTEVSKSVLPVTLPFSYRRSNTSSTNNTLTRYLPEEEVYLAHNYRNLHSFFGLHICWSRWSDSSGFTHAHVHANFNSHTTSSPLPLVPHTTYSHFIISIHKEGIFTVFAAFLPLLLSLYFHKTMRMWWGHHQHCVPWIITHQFKL